ncbi:MAG: translation initiation factor [Planctomycetota bacterium]|nr:translation initiation factor [Planctomycetota bacterium]
MAARRSQPEPERAPQPGPTLRHNPFAALKGGAVTPSSSLENASPTPVHEPEREKRAKTGEKQSKPVVHAAIVVRREKKGRGGKAVTLAEGPGLAGRDLEALARELAKSLGAGARVEDGAIVVQGEQTDRLVAQLEQRGFSGIVRGN